MLSSEEKKANKKGLTAADQDILASSFNSKTLDVIRSSKEVNSHYISLITFIKI